MVKNLPANTGDIRDVGSIPSLRRSSGEGNGYPLQYSCLTHGQRSLVGYRPWGHKQSDMTEHTHKLVLNSIHCLNSYLALFSSGF